MFVVTLPTSAQKNPRAFALKAKKVGADVLEIRGDLTPTVKAFKSPLPLLVSPRGTGSGLIERLKPEYVDLDLKELGKISMIPSGTKLIISYHNYDQTPSLADLKKIVQKMRTIISLRSRCLPAAKQDSIHPRLDTRSHRIKIWAIKIATKIVRYEDLLTHRDLQEWMSMSCKAAKCCGSTKQIVLGMGDKAHLSRITSPMRNALTYTFLPGTDAAAPGQLPMAMYRLIPQVRRPALFGIIGGEQILSSLSPLIHNLLFGQHRMNAIYSCFPTDDFKGTMKVLTKLGIAGLSATAPFKHDAFHYADRKDPIAKSLGSANTLIYSLPPAGEGSGMREVKAFNTDVIGVERGYPFLKSAKSIAILGAGGVVPAVIEGIRRINPEVSISVFARDPKKAERDLLHHCHGERSRTMTMMKIRLLKEISNAVADVVICAVSQDIILPLSKSGKKSVAIDLRYGKQTTFMKSAAAKGFRVYDGLPMLIHQALAQFELFTGISAESIPLPINKKMFTE